MAGPALRQRRNAEAGRAGRVRPLPRPSRRRRGDRRGRQHGRARRRQHRRDLRLRPCPQPVGHRTLPGGLLERPRRLGRRPAGRRRRRRRRARIGPLPGRLLRPDRAEADLRPLGDGRPPCGRRRRRRSSPDRSASTPPTAGCSPRPSLGRPLPRAMPRGCESGSSATSPPRTSTPRWRRPAGTAIELLRDRDRGDDPRGRPSRSRGGDDRRDPDREHRRAGRGGAGAAQPAQPGDQPDQPRRRSSTGC